MLRGGAFKPRTSPFAFKGLGAAALIVAIKVFGFTWWQLSYLSLAVGIVWGIMAMRARREYLRSFRRSLESRAIEATDLRISGGDLSTIETLVQELSQPDSARVVYAIDMLESLDKRNLALSRVAGCPPPRAARDWIGAPGHRPPVAPAGAADAERR